MSDLERMVVSVQYSTVLVLCIVIVSQPVSQSVRLRSFVRAFVRCVVLLFCCCVVVVGHLSFAVVFCQSSV